MNYLHTTYPQYALTFTSTADNGLATWTNLIRLSTLMATNPQMAVWDTMNDYLASATHYRATEEAFIRRIWSSNPNCRQAIMNFFAVNDRLVDDVTALNQAAINDLKALVAHYAIPLIDYQASINALVAGGGHLSTYFADNTHPSIAGHTVAFNLLQAQLPVGGLAQPSPLPARLYSESADYEHDPLIKNGTAYDSRTGVWSDNGTSVSSSEVGATITYSGTFASIGCWRSDYQSASNDVQISIDDGAFADATFNQNGMWVGNHVAHTIIIKVKSGTTRIDEFWAI